MKVNHLSIAPVLVLLMVIAVSCEKESLIAITETEKTAPDEEEQEISVKSLYGPIAMTEAQKDMTLELNAFSLSVFEKIVKERPEENFVFSPLSLAYSLAMCADGANGETASQIKTALGFGGKSQEEINRYFQAISEGIPSVDSLSKFFSANSVWIDNLFPVKHSFIESASRYYAANVNNVDFNSVSAWGSINAWCREKTNGLISSVPAEGYTDMAIINAISFSGIWGHEFDDELINDYFHSRTSDIPEEFMTSENKYGYARLLTCRLLSLPYGRGGYSLLIAYPFDGIGFGDTLSELNTVADRILMTQVSGYLQKLKVKLPKFKIDDCVQSFIPILESMGINAPFSKDADFRGISDNQFNIGKIVQKTCIGIDEKGTEAASVTEIVRLMLNPGGSLINDSEFYVDSPFMFFVMESGSGSILYAGQKVK